MEIVNMMAANLVFIVTSHLVLTNKMCYTRL